MQQLKEFLSLPPNEHPRGHRRTRSTFWYELLFAILIGMAWGIIGSIFALTSPIPSILGLGTWIFYLYYGARGFRNDLWDREHP